MANIEKNNPPENISFKEIQDHDSGNSVKSIGEIHSEILEDTPKQQPEKHLSLSEFLEGSTEFNHNFILNKKAKSLALELFTSLKLREGYKPKEKLREFEILLTNLLDHIKSPVAVSLDIKKWTRTKYIKKSYYTVELIHGLHKRKLIYMVKGYFTMEQSRMARIWAHEKLIDHFHDAHPYVIYQPVNLIELRELNSNELIDYKETGFTCRLEKILKKANEVNESAHIRYKQFNLNCNLVAIFKGNFSQYGRLHTRGQLHYQSLNNKKPKYERNEITINGDRIVELDYSALHPMLLYVAEGIQYQDDPYSAIEKDPAARFFLKRALLYMVNADFNKAQKAINFWLLNRTNEEKQALAAIGITRAQPIMDKVLEVHKPIAHYLCQGKMTGLRLFNKDARIAIEIVNHFANRNIPILCIHDSFIVQEQHENELKEVMIKMYAKLTKTKDRPEGFSCGIKKRVYQ